MEIDVSDDKIARTEYSIHELIQKRWSPRAFADRPVDPELLRQLFDAARWAPSSFNEQPWRFIIARKDDQEAFEQLSQVLNENNSRWAADAPVLGLTIAKRHFEKTGKENRVALHDLGQSMAYLTLEAMRHDLYVHQMAGILPEKARELYDISDRFEPVTMFTIGYLGDPDQLPEDLARKEIAARSRLPIDEIIFRDRWENK